MEDLVKCQYGGTKSNMCDKFFGCLLCLKNSYGSEDCSVYWGKNGGILPRTVPKNSDGIYKFKYIGGCHHYFVSKLIFGRYNYHCPQCEKEKYYCEDSITIEGVGGKIAHCEWCEGNFCSSKLCIENRGRCRLCMDVQLCGNGDCVSCYNLSFTSVRGNKGRWCSKNLPITPRQVLKTSKKFYWIRCLMCRHISSQPLTINMDNGRWCPFCFGIVICGTLGCIQCFNVSFASSCRVNTWSIRNVLEPFQVHKRNVVDKFWFHCFGCGKEYESLLRMNLITAWCPNCM